MDVNIINVNINRGRIKPTKKDRYTCTYESIFDLHASVNLI